jgi:hydrogenase maturation protease
MRLVVFGWGNESRGDDGLGPALLRRIEAERFKAVRTVEDYQLQIEHALDVDDAEMVLFIDAARQGPAPFGFTEIGPRHEITPSTHALSPESLLDIYAQVLKAEPPPAFVLAVKGERFALGEGLSEEGAARLEAAWDFLGGLMKRREVEAWRAEAGFLFDEQATVVANALATVGANVMRPSA